ncbi:ArsR/SmtB family transcription factor [Ectobacillus ponti]|uniref:Metalloregulator ArsR/SmtB family transcription factor n=1 Tax=Ectobacillus ponti TaxID=2961894 RepID=A0AA41X324_9BACI|nr:metalloregulator ArsR/SmtB family transcription factor [Ectobacillus ponti]MCP8967697.1 metalloregulator ArsR/SmtB family transcription factor [Ectobacillus ponti]
MQGFKANEEKYVESAETIKVLAHPVRLGLVNQLITKGPSNVTSLYEEFELPQSTISQHLAKLRSGNIIKGTRKGLEIYYEVVDDKVRDLVQMIVH